MTTLRRFLFSLSTATLFVVYYINRENDFVEVTNGPQHVRSSGNLNESNDNPSMSSAGNDSVVVDLLSTGSLHRPDLLLAQYETFGTHASVRHFFQTNEYNDTESTCHEQLTTDGALSIAKFCKRADRSEYAFLQDSQSIYMAINALERKTNPAGWVCAQKRPIDGLYTALEKYKGGELSLPDYLIFMDDDTFLNMEVVIPHLIERYPPDTAYSVAGCLMRMRGVEFSFPFGGFGTVLTRAALENLLKPIYCNDSEKDAFSQQACVRISEDNVGEAAVFTDGMSVADLMYDYTFQQAYLDYTTWEDDSPGFCMHSDTAIGYFINYYRIPILAVRPGNDDNDSAVVEEDRMFAYKDSEWPMFQHDAKSEAKHHQCDNMDDTVCTKESDICHYVTPERMRQVHQSIVA